MLILHGHELVFHDFDNKLQKANENKHAHKQTYSYVLKAHALSTAPQEACSKIKRVSIYEHVCQYLNNIICTYIDKNISQQPLTEDRSFSFEYIHSPKHKKPLLMLRSYTFAQTTCDRRYWNCSKKFSTKCPAKLRFDYGGKCGLHEVKYARLLHGSSDMAVTNPPYVGGVVATTLINVAPAYTHYPMLSKDTWKLNYHRMS
ncbi:unnamed protein product [Diatraea saccharalis]|uniref:Uncharacterized protein n=1 Tax=Diatraea saccharalis TaxID=40085 RepID=A0A9N9R121_9NEOP|nr:unnamed protein product [Diatraea saccharalis]